MAAIGCGRWEDATEDTQLVWKWLHGKAYPEIFSAVRQGIAKARVQNAAGLIKMMDVSDEAICLLVLDVKCEELLKLIATRNEELKRKVDLQKEKTKAQEKNQVWPAEKQKELEQLERFKPQKGRKRKLGKEDGEPNWELMAHQDKYTVYITRVNRTRGAESSGAGWYAAAWEEIKAKHGLTLSAAASSCDDGSQTGASQSKDGKKKNAPTHFPANWEPV